MAETKLSASQIIITASDIGAAGAYETMPEPTSSNVGQIVQYTGTDTANYTQGYFYKCISNGNGENSIASDPVTITDFSGKSQGATGPTSIMFSRDVYYKYDPNHYMLYGGEQNIELVVESDEYEEAVVYFDGEDGPSARVRITQELDVEAAFAQMGFYITFAEGYGMPEYIMCDMPAEYSSNESATTIEKHITVGDADLWIEDAIAFGNAFCLDNDTPVTSQVKFTCTSTGSAPDFNWENLTTGEEGSTTPEEYNSFMFTEVEEGFTVGDYFIVQYTNNNSESGYSWEQINVQPNSGGAQYEYTTELEFTPNVDTEGAIIIELAKDNVATLQIGQYVSYEDGGVWDDPVEDAVYTAFMQPSLDTSVGASKILWTSPVNRLIWMDGYASTGQNEQSVLTLLYQYNDSALVEDHCKIVLKIISDKELTIRAIKDSSELVIDTNAGIMALPIPLYQEHDQTRFYPVQQGGYINWEPIPQSEGLPSQAGQSGKFLTTDGTDASWSDKPLVNKSTYSLFVNNYTDAPITVSGSDGSLFGVKNYMGIQPITVSGNNVVCVGGKIQSGSTISTNNWTVINGYNHINAYTYSPGEFSFAVYGVAHATRSIQIGLGTNNDANTVKIANANGNYEIMSEDGTIPTDRFTGSNTTPTNAGQYMLTITKDSNGNITRSWEPVVAPSTPATTPVLQGTSTYWIEDQVTHIISQTITVQGVTASNTIFVAPAPASSADYAAAGIICTAQNINQLTFTCTTIPANDIEVNIVIL